MKQFGKILKFELKYYMTNKVFVGVTVFLMVLLAVVMFFPRITESFDSGETSSDGDKPTMLVCVEDQQMEGMAHTAFSAAFTDYDVKVYQGTEAEVEKMVVSGEAECAFVLNGLTSYTYFVDNLSMYDVNTAVADEVLLEVYRMNAMMEGGMSLEDITDIMGQQITHEIQTLGKDQMDNYFYTYIMIMALYMVILLYGQMVATNVATEKSSRAMELLITSAKPVSMMFGKVIASCIAGLIQLIAVFGTAFVCFNLNRAYWDGNGIVASMFDMPIELLVYLLVFFILGFFIYAFLYGAVGSTASKLEDINTSVMPITMLFIIGFFVVVIGMPSGDVDAVLIMVCSFIPFPSSISLFPRIAMSTVPVWEILVSIGILIVSVIGTGILAAKIYRVGVLLYGTTPKIKDILKAIKKA